VTAKYTWSGFRGRDGSVAAEIRLYQNGNLEGSSGTAIAADPSGGEVTSTFGTDSSAVSNDFFVDGRLVKRRSGRTVWRSERMSSIETHPCFAD
jgi:hypothetical protein